MNGLHLLNIDGLWAPSASIVQLMVQRAQGEDIYISQEFSSFEFFSLFLQLNRRLVGLLHHFESPLTTIESHCLAELDHESDIIARELAHRVSSEKSTISRTLHALAKRQLISQTSSKQDLRSKVVRITSKGKLFLQKDVEARNKEVIQCTYALTSSDREELTLFMNLIADYLGERALHALQEMEPLLVSIRRAGKALGIIRGTVFETEFATPYMQVLWLALQEGGRIRLKDLVFTLPYPASEISHLLSKLEEQALIMRRPDDNDKRRSIVELTPNGFSTSLKLAESSRTFFKRILKDISQKDMNRFHEVLKKSVICPLPSELIEDKAGWSCDSLEDEDSISSARALLIEQYIIENLHREAGFEFINPSNKTTVLTKEGKFQALLEYRVSAEQIVEFINFCNTTQYPARVIFCELAWAVIEDLDGHSLVELSPILSNQLDLPSELSIEQLKEAITR